ncbi:GH25 family lysozyme [Lysinibacillus xylanilyticus]|uniref:GH25 family lysozyme n=1 Tax=Lysinibacillus xylanilyticus TaxID=582475 RepID=UPI002E1FE5C6|nr:GH25 family lysozyme [Lysinibacillus xylanilyticus]
MSKIIDISHHQGDIDWSKASKEVDLAIIRTQYGTSTIDREYVQNINGCKKYNVPFGVYIYVTFKNKNEALAQARDF